MIVRKTTPQEARRVAELFAICFEQPMENGPIRPGKPDTDTHWAAFDRDGQMMSTFTVTGFSIHFDGHDCPMAGIGAVATLPQYRRRGGIRACFQAALPEMYRDGYDFSFLYPFSTAYYRKFGYECCVRRYAWQVDLAQLRPEDVGGTFRLAEPDEPLADAIRAVDQVWQGQYNMEVLRRDYQWAERPDPAGKREFTYVWFDDGAQPRSYATFRTENEANGRNLVCSRFCFTDRAGFAGLLGLFKTMASDHVFARFQTPAQEALAYWLPEWSLGAVKWELLASSGMVRVVNAARVLEQARYLGSGRIVLALSDPQIPENNGSFAVTFENGQALQVAPTDEAPDAAMPIHVFSALIAGACPWPQAPQAFAELRVLRDTPALGQVFYRKELMISTYF